MGLGSGIRKKTHSGSRIRIRNTGNMNIRHPQVIQGCRGVNASLESQVENKPVQ
jgi:hypothetical protein